MIKSIFRFLKRLNGIFIVRDTYLEGDMKEFRDKIFSGEAFHHSQDKINLRKDIRNIGRDMHKAFREYKRIHG